MADPSTIVAAASGTGRSPRALVRVSGPGVGALLARLLDAPASTRGVHAGRIRMAERGPTLPVLLLRFPGPGSYTGEDSAEFLLPGNPLLVERVVAVLAAQPGVREATPGEFSARGYLNGRMSIAQAEGVAATIAARNSAELDAARSLLSGEAGRRYREWGNELADLLALVEAGVDFTDQEDVVPIPAAELMAKLRAVRGQILGLVGAEAGREESDPRPVVVLAGAPNAGKSTLFNALLGRSRAVVSEVAGTTRDVLREELDLSRDIPGGPVVTLTDLAGLDDGAGWQGTDAEAQRAAAETVAGADVVVWCDPTGRFERAPFRQSRGGVLRVRTKADLPGARPTAATAEEAGGLSICALDGWNLGALRRSVAEAAWGSTGRGADAGVVVPRHRRALGQAAARLDEAIAVVDDGDRGSGGRGGLASPELIAGLLRAALDSIEELTGRVTPDDVIGRVFARFCVGK